MSGEETYRRLRLIRSDVRVVLASGYSDDQALANFAGKDLAGFLKKPFTAAQIGEMVKRVLKTGAHLE
jgi:FixJ family two-component response regulator